MVAIYILKCDQDKYYVGKSNNADFRIKDHFEKGGSQWTKKYKPIEAKNVAKAMVAIAQNHDQKTVFESNELNEIEK